ncbi:MAG TPA: metabolite traffic protein EboE [Vicinamibacterales bacterium]
MKLRGGFDLTYCSNIHAGESWADVRGALASALPDVRRHLGTTGPLAIGLRLSAQAAEELEQPAALEAFTRFLRDGNYYVPTINGFPFGAFHRARVKETVYLPDWRDRRRIDYSNRLARVLAALLIDRGLTEGSISTVPGAFKGHAGAPEDQAAIARGILQHAEQLAALRDSTGVTIALAIEPEPACVIETTDEAIDFFTRYLLDESFVRAGSRLTVEQVRRHVGICFDACHMAVEFEDHAASLAALDRAGIRVPKFQISAALRVSDPSVGSPGRRALEKFADGVYLHQVVAKSGHTLRRYVDLPDALAGASKDAPQREEWRIHFHVPVFLGVMGDLETTQPDLEAVLDLIKKRTDAPCLEVETYTWDVLPVEHRTSEMSEAIARELSWTRQRMEA